MLQELCQRSSGILCCNKRAVSRHNREVAHGSGEGRDPERGARKLGGGGLLGRVCIWGGEIWDGDGGHLQREPCGISAGRKGIFSLAGGGKGAGQWLEWGEENHL